MRTKLIPIALFTALALGAQAGVITLGNTWKKDSTDAVALTGESATGFTAATTKGAWMYQLASTDFASEAFGIGDTAIMSFTTTVNADALSDPQDFRFAMWDETGQGGASTRMDWGPLTAGNVAAAGVGDNMSPTGIGSFDASVTSGTAMPSVGFTSNSVVNVSYSVTKRGANLFDVSLTWDDMTFAGTSLAYGTATQTFDSISGIGIRINADAGHVNNFTVSNLSVEVVAATPGTKLTYQLGGDSSVWDMGWSENVITNSGVTPTEYSWSFGVPYYYEELSNVVFTVTAVETNDAMYIGNAFLAGTNGNAARLDTNEMVKVWVSYVDPDNKLLDLNIHSVGPYWNNNADEETLFSDGSAVFSITNSANGFMKSYDSMGLEQLSLANTATWSMSVYETNNTTFSGLGGFKLEYTVDAEYIEPPVVTNPPIGEIEFSTNWVFEVGTSNMTVLSSSSDGFSVEMTNSLLPVASKRYMYQMDADSFDAPFQVGETATWSFTAAVGTTMALNLEGMGLQASLWDADLGSDNGVSFQVDWGTPAGDTMKLSASDVATAGYIGAVSGADVSTGVPSNALDAPGASADFVVVMEHISATNMLVSLTFDDVTLTGNYAVPNTFDSLDELGFRFRQTDDNALIISNMKLEITNPNFAPYDVWASANGLEVGVNDGKNADPDSDTMENLLEYALGGDPLDPSDAAALLPTVNQTGNYLNLVYRRRLDAVSIGLDYNVYSSTDLVFGLMTNPTEEAGSVALDADFESVTNRVSTDVEANQFMQLEVSEQ